MNKPKERFKLIPTVHLFLIQKGQVLLLLRQNTGFEDGKYSVPAGHLDGNEAVTKGMAREALEETGIKIKPKDLELAHIMHRKNYREQIDFYFTAKKYTGAIKNMEPQKCGELKWFKLNSLPKNTVNYIKVALQNYQKKIIFSEFGW